MYLAPPKRSTVDKLVMMAIHLYTEDTCFSNFGDEISGSDYTQGKLH